MARPSVCPVCRHTGAYVGNGAFACLTSKCQVIAFGPRTTHRRKPGVNRSD